MSPPVITNPTDNEPGPSEPEAQTQLGRQLRRAVSQVNKGYHDFLLLSEESQSDLKKRRRTVMARRYKMKNPPERTNNTKEPVIKITMDAVLKLKEKTNKIINDNIVNLPKTETPVDTEFTREFLVSSRTAQMPPPKGTAPAELASFLPPKPTDELDSRPSLAHPKGKHYIFESGTAPKGLATRGPKKFKTLKRYMSMENGDELEYRPIFTYYVTFAQLMILVISMWVYGIAPIGFGTFRRNSSLLVTSLTNENVEIEESGNIWIGNRVEDLIHIGARFTPCMRDDPGIKDERDRGIMRERTTACCVRHDRSGCIQIQKEQCSENLSSWRQITHQGTVIGSVCGQDPRYCEEPASAGTNIWPADITSWPRCRKQPPTSLRRNGDLTNDAHMGCQVVGRPCCLGTYGHCEITTRDHCDFARGAFHEEAALCSQVSCLGDACGMFPFLRDEKPDQIYRVLISLFLHAGILHFMLTCLLQMRWMRDLEKIYGPHRIGIIYMFSGWGGNLASAIFVPYRADVGPSAALFGVMAIFIGELWETWDEIENKSRAVFHATLPIVVGLLCGLTPWTDNFGHVFGFLIGFILTTMPHSLVTRGRWTCSYIMRGCIVATLFVCLLVWFYAFPGFQCEFCQRLTCIWELFGDACETHSVAYKPRMNHKF